MDQQIINEILKLLPAPEQRQFTRFIERYKLARMFASKKVLQRLINELDNTLLTVLNEVDDIERKKAIQKIKGSI